MEDKILNNICDLIIKDERHLLKLILTLDYKLDYVNNIDIDMSLERYYLLFSSIKYNELNFFCGAGNFPKYEYIFHKYFNKYYNKMNYYNLDLNNIKSINNNEIDFIIFIIFSTNEEIYNKSFRDKINLSREILINNFISFIIKYCHLDKDKEFENKIHNFCKQNYFYKLTFQGDFFLDLKNIIYNLIFTNKYKLEDKQKLFYFFVVFLSIINGVIIQILFLPLYYYISYKKENYYLTTCCLTDSYKNILTITNNSHNVIYKIKFKNNIFENNKKMII